MAWIDQLQAASFRGIPFGVLSSDSQFGRRLHVHEYPFRDDPWPEDIGRATRRFTVRGFLVSNSRVYGGGDVLAQRSRLVGAAEASGAGTLVHPTYGQLSVSLVTLTVTERAEEGHYVEFVAVFVEAGQRKFPAVGNATGSIVSLFSSGLNSAAGASFLTRAVADLKLGASVVNQLVTTATTWAQPAIALVRDATNLSHLTSTLPGVFGRYFGGANVGGLGLLGSTGEQLAEASTSVADLINAGAAARLLVQRAVSAVTQAASAGSASSVVSSAQGLAAAVRDATTDPNDGLRLLLQLAQQPDDDPVSSVSPVGLAAADIQDASHNLFRLAAVAALADASSRYQPSSYDDAVRVRDLVTAALDVEILISGDVPDDDVFAALRKLRQAVVQDLTERGADLATTKTFTTGRPLPSLALAHRFYRDSSREDQLVRQVDPRHPLFMPTSFRALSA